MHELEQMITAWREDIAKEIFHPTLVAYTGKPELNNLRMLSLFLPLLQQRSTQRNVAYYATAIIYLALTSHDHVNKTGTPSKEQQLRVLAGDYYSGKYYQLLATHHEPELISKLTESIRLMTEAKTILYDQVPLSATEKESAQRVIASAPTRALFQHEEKTDFLKVSMEISYLATLIEEGEVGIEESVDEIEYLIKSQAELDQDLKRFISEQIHQAVNPQILQDRR